MPVLSQNTSYIKITSLYLDDCKATLGIGVGWNDKIELLSYLMDTEAKKGKILKEENTMVLKRCIHSWDFTGENGEILDITEANIQLMVKSLSANDGKVLRTAIDEILYQKIEQTEEDKKK